METQASHWAEKPLAEIRARLVDPELPVEGKRAAINDLMAYRDSPAAGELLDELVKTSGDSPILWLLVRAYGYLGKPEKVPLLIPFLDHKDVEVAMSAFKSVVTLNPQVAVEQGRRLVIARSLDMSLPIATTLMERCAAVSTPAFREWMWAPEPQLRVAAICFLKLLPEEECLSLTLEMLRREQKKTVVKLLRKVLVARIAKEQAKALRKFRSELLFKLENVQNALRTLVPVPDPNSLVLGQLDIARLLGVDPKELADAAKLIDSAEALPLPGFPPGSKPSRTPEKPAVAGASAALLNSLDGKGSTELFLPPLAEPPPPEHPPEPPASSPPVQHDPPSRIQQTIKRLLGRRALPAPPPAPERRRDDRRVADPASYAGQERRQGGRRRRNEDPYAIPEGFKRKLAVGMGVIIALVVTVFYYDTREEAKPAPGSSAPADSPLGNVGSSVDATGEVTSFDAAKGMVHVKLERGQVIDVLVPGGAGGPFTPGQTVHVLGVIRQIGPGQRLLVLAFTITRA